MTADRDAENSHVLFLAGDPGGACALLPVIKAWRGRKTILAYRHAADLFQGQGLPFERLDEIRASILGASTWLEKTRPGVICAATSVNGVDWECHFFLASRKLGIPSVAVLDYWSNYAPRFSLGQNLDALPDAICIMDERARIEMIENGFSAERLNITGQPVLDEARRWQARLSGDYRRRFREKLGLAADTRAFLFVSQPLSEMRRATGDARSCDDEFASLEKLAHAVAAVSAKSKLLLIKLHPREAPNKYNRIVPNLSCAVRVVEPHVHRWEACIAVDCVLGMDSMLMEEARAMGCLVKRIEDKMSLSIENYQPHEKQIPVRTPLLAADSIAQIIVRQLTRDTLSQI